jgi:hypothetical protein
MSVTYAGSDAFPPNITIPSDGDDDTAAAVDVALEGLADRTAWIKARLSAAGGNVDFDTVTVHTLLHALASVLFDAGGLVANASGAANWVIGKNGRLQFADDGRITPRHVTALASNHTYSIADGESFDITGAGNRIALLSHTGAVNGDRMIWTAYGGGAGDSFSVRDISSFTTSTSATIENVSGSFDYVLFFFLNGTWWRGPTHTRP